MGRGRSGKLALTELQVKKLFDTIDTLMDEVLFRLAISTGIRREDIVKIKWKDVDLKAYAMTFYEKKKKQTRLVFIGGKVVKAIEKYLKYLNKKQPWLFPGRKKNKHINGKTAYNHLQTFLKKADLPGRPFHALRATCIKLAQKRGWSIEEVMVLTGDTFRTIKEHYDTPSDEEMKNATQNSPIE